MPTLDYVWKRAEEFAWAGLVAFLLFWGEVLVTFDPDTITDWRAWLVAGLGGSVRAVFAAILAARTKPTTP
jgi:hypothetical protein